MNRTLKQLVAAQIVFCVVAAGLPYFLDGIKAPGYSPALALLPVALCAAFSLGVPFARRALKVFSLATAILSFVAVVTLIAVGSSALHSASGAVLGVELVIASLLYVALRTADPQLRQGHV